MSRATWLSGEAAARQRRPVPVAVAAEPEPPPAVVEPVTVRPAPKPTADLPARLAQALELLEALGRAARTLRGRRCAPAA